MQAELLELALGEAQLAAQLLELLFCRVRALLGLCESSFELLGASDRRLQIVSEHVT